MVDLREIREPDEVQKFPGIISSAWSNPDMSIEFCDVINAMRFNGGLVLGAYEGDELIGMQFSFAGYRGGKTYLYSHMTGLIQQKKYSGIGHSMKLYQKKWAIDHGYDVVIWTFDPTKSLNAYFNIHKLGAVSRTISRNFYGKFEGPMTIGMTSDRLIAEWWVNDPLQVSHDSEIVNAAEILENGSYKYLTDLQQIDSDTVFLPTIRDVSQLLRDRKETVVKFKNDLSGALDALFKRGYIVSDFRKTKEETGYILARNTSFQIDHRVNIFL